jgi:hypothetical protein
MLPLPHHHHHYHQFRTCTAVLKLNTLIHPFNSYTSTQNLEDAGSGSAAYLWCSDRGWLVIWWKLGAKTETKSH